MSRVSRVKYAILNMQISQFEHVIGREPHTS